MKYLDLITDAYRLRNVIDEQQSPSPEQAKDALKRLNQMCATWKARGIDIGYFSTNLVTDTLTIPEWAEQGVTAHLAIRIAAGGSITPELSTLAQEGYDTICIATVGKTLGEVDAALPVAEGQRGRGNFFNG